MTIKGSSMGFQVSPVDSAFIYGYSIWFTVSGALCSHPLNTVLFLAQNLNQSSWYFIPHADLSSFKRHKMVTFTLK